MLTHLIDTDICIYAMKSRNIGLARKLGEIHASCAVSDISVFELYAGAFGYAEPDRRLAVIENFLSRLTPLAFSTRAARMAGKLRQLLESKGMMIGGYDLLIASTALVHDLTLVTNNTGEFSRVPMLKLETWDRQEK